MNMNEKICSGNRDLSHTSNNPNSCPRYLLHSPTQTVSMEQKYIILWGVLHITTAICLVLGIYYAKEYMHMPDDVTICDFAKNLYRGKSCNVLCQATAEDITRKATMAFLTRNGEDYQQQALKALFGRTAQKSLQTLIRNSQTEFKEQNIRQIPVIKKIRIVNAPEKDQFLAFAEGILHRTGVYMEIPYRQKLKFVLGLRLVRSGSLSEYPLRVLRMTYYEKSIYDNKKGDE